VSLYVEQDDAPEVGAVVPRAIGSSGGVVFVPGAFVHAALPVLDPGDHGDWVRSSRTVNLRLRSGVDPSGVPIGLPHGSIARLLLSWVATEAKRTGIPEVRIGTSLGMLMCSLGFDARSQSGGVNGTITRVREQARRLFSCSAVIERLKDGTARGGSLWTPSPTLFSDPIGSVVTLTEHFMTEIVDHGVPTDQSTLRGLSRSALSMDIYVWLSWRFSFLRGDQKVSWEQLQLQFGSASEQTKKFREIFTTALERVREVYPDIRVSTGPYGLTLRPSKTSVPKLRYF
jgi:hypothetical protein